MRKSINRGMSWSAYEEKWLRRVLWFDYCAMWITGIVGISFAFWRQWAWVVTCFAVVLIYFVDFCIQRRKYDTMLLNKPRSIGGLTEWVKLRPWQTEICCACGAIVHIDGAPWFPNSVDAGGGRYSIVCPCGIGYYKLREEKAVTPAKISAGDW